MLRLPPGSTRTDTLSLHDALPISLYAFSSGNWKRPEDEVNDLMGLLHHYLLNEITALHAKGVRLSVIGDYRRLAPDLVRLLEYGMEMTAANNRMTLVLALNYGGQDELVRVVAMLDRVEIGKGAGRVGGCM